MVRRVHVHLTIQRADLIGQDLVVRYQQRTEIQRADPRSPGGTFSQTFAEVGEDTWQGRPEGWRIVVARDLGRQALEAQGQAAGGGAQASSQDWSRMTPEQRQMQLIVMQQRMRNLNRALDGQACVLGYGHDCGGRW